MNLDLLRQLAQGWLDCAEADDLDAEDRPAVRETFRAYARVRRNCATELLRLLDDLQKRKPADRRVSRPKTDCESA